VRPSIRLTQAALARRMGVSRNTVNRWEMGLHPFSPMAELLLQCIERETKKMYEVDNRAADGAGSRTARATRRK
jgi:DNA-binding transcriptional regulator YiaG